MKTQEEIEHRRAVANKSRAKRIAENKQAGLCVDCPNPADTNYTRCSTCRTRQKEWRQAKANQRYIAGLCSKCDQPRTTDSTRCTSCLKLQRTYATARHDRLRDEAFAAYGGYQCACCGEPEKLFLELDHINGGGNEHRRQLHDNSTSVYLDLKRQGYPPIMQPLCSNCNKGRQRNGGICPHKAQQGG